MFGASGAVGNPIVPVHVPGHEFAHVPSEPGTLHDWHIPLHAVLQQNPLAQKPERHSAAEEHIEPIGALLQAPVPLHVRAHSLSGSVLAAMTPHEPSTPLPFLAAEHA